MKILFMDWPALGAGPAKRTFAQLGHVVECFDFPQSTGDIRAGEELTAAIAQAILRTESDMVFSFNFFPVVAMAAHACRKKYMCWVYDSPAVLLYSMAVFLPGNYIFHFDSSEVERMRRDGVEHVWYMPLAADVGSYDAMLPDEAAHKKYDADIAMLGSMYRDKFRYFEKYTNFDAYLTGYLDALVAAQEQLYGEDVLEDALSGDIMKRVIRTVPLMDGQGDHYDTAAWNFANYYLAMRVTANEREHILNALSQHYDVALYAGGDIPDMPQVRIHGSAEYYKEAPLAIKCAKINLNISLRSIHSGIPLRVMDIMGCGGFVLSNYQADMCEDFVAGEDFVYYESVEDAVDKAGYYLCHEDERLRIAKNGYEKVKERHNYRVKLAQMLELI